MPPLGDSKCSISQLMYAAANSETVSTLKKPIPYEIPTYHLEKENNGFSQVAPKRCKAATVGCTKTYAPLAVVQSKNTLETSYSLFRGH